MRMDAIALIRSAVGVVWLVVAMTLGAELSAPFKAYLAELTGHHWVAKSVISAVAFVLFYFLFLPRKSDGSKGVLDSVLFLMASVILGGLAIFSFYFWHFLNA